jgi:CRISPR-associated endoribonuclease Cas6
MLTVHCLEVVAEAATPLALDVYCGSALRGAFFRSIWGRFCTNRESPTCDVCPLLAACPVAALVAPLRDEAPRGRDVPRPYVITPPQNEQERYEQGDTFTFGFALIGNAGKLYPYVIRSFQEMERNNLGHPLPELQGKRGRIRIRELHSYHPLTGERQPLWQRGVARPDKLQLCVTSDDVAVRARQLPTDRLTLHFLSPTRLVAGEHILRRPDFHVLALRLAQRLEQVQLEYGSSAEGEANIAPLGRDWYLAIKAWASDIRLVQDETRWVDIQSYSTRQRQGMHIGGFVGRASFTGDITHLRELLVWGEVLHVGKNIVKGGGAYRIEA